MRNWILGSMVALLSLASATAAGQAGTWDPPRTPDGQPDMQGFWSKGPVGSSYSIEGTFVPSELAVLATIPAANPFRTTPPKPGAQAPFRRAIVDPPDGMIPYQPWAAAKRKEIAENHITNPRWDTLDPQVRCALTGVPRINYQPENPFRILQLPGYVVIVYEWVHASRVVPLDGRPHLPESIKLWMGDSRGRWEGNTLVVDVTSNNDMKYLDQIGSFHSDALHVVERWTLVDADTINYEAAIEDPKVFTRPWKIAFSFTRNRENGFELIEHACHEGNNDWEITLTESGAQKGAQK
jgi:hypothetical protein